jgi:CRP-like cAMP-binding protein
VVAKPKVANILASVPLFEGLSKKQLKRLGDITEVAKFMPQATVIKQGDPGDSLYVITSGEAKVVANGRTIHRLLPGDHFGEISLIDGEPRSATVVSDTPLEMFMVTTKDFNRVLKEHPDIAIAILEGMARSIRRVDHSIAR